MRTFMPRIVPSGNLVPVTFTYGQEQSDLQRGLPDPFRLTFQTWGQSVLVLVEDLVSIVEVGDIATTHSLGEAFPNPAKDEITFRFSVLQPGHTTLTITNVIGQTVATVVDQYFGDSREYSVRFPIANLPNGTYYYTLTTGPRVETKMFNVVR
jgi:hypothetical protein